MYTTLWLHSTAHIFFPNGIFPLVHGFRCQKTANTKEREEGADNFFSSPIGHGSFLKEWKFLTQFSKCLLWLIDSLKLFHLKKDKLLLKEIPFISIPLLVVRYLLLEINILLCIHDYFFKMYSQPRLT